MRSIQWHVHVPLASALNLGLSEAGEGGGSEAPQVLCEQNLPLAEVDPEGLPPRLPKVLWVLRVSHDNP